MPDPDGFALLSRLDELRGESYLPVLVLTGDATSTARERALDAGAHDFVTKPFDATEVLLRVRNLLETRFLYRRLEQRAGSLLVDAARSEAARAGIVDRLNRLSSGHGLADLGSSICLEVVSGPTFVAAAVMALPGAGLATFVAAEGGLMTDELRSGPIPEAHSHYLADRAARGPWMEPWMTGGTDHDYASRVSAAGVRTAVYVPLVEDGRAVGLLAAGVSCDIAEAETSGALDALIEHGVVARAMLVPQLVTRHREALVRAEVDAVIRDSAFWPVFQPVVEIDTRLIIGAEALTRFADGMRPDLRFEAADEVGVGVRLEEATLRAAVAASSDLPRAAWLSINVSPALVLSGDTLDPILAQADRPIVLEITEHTAVADYAALRNAIDRLRPQVRLAIDDAGAGFASFRHILELQPDFVKLDIGLIRGIDTDPARQALVAGMRYFATKTGCTLLAEGIETEEEATTLRSLAVWIGQGYLLGRPAVVPWPARESPALSPSASGRPRDRPERGLLTRDQRGMGAGKGA